MDQITLNNITSNTNSGSPKFAMQLYGQAVLNTNIFNNYPSVGYELGYFDTSGNILDARYNYWQTTDPTQLRARLYDNFTDPTATQGEILFDSSALYPSVGITLGIPWQIPGSIDIFQN